MNEMDEKNVVFFKLKNCNFANLFTFSLYTCRSYLRNKLNVCFKFYGSPKSFRWFFSSASIAVPRVVAIEHF